MSLEQQIESLQVAIVELTNVLKANGIASPAAAAATTAATEDKGAKAAKGGKAAKTAGTEEKAAVEKASAPAQVHTLEQLKALLMDYKQVFSMAEAKKLLPGIGYESSNAVPEDKIDEVFAYVEGLLKAKADEGDL